MKKCEFCGNQVPEKGQCNKCGFIDGLRKKPTDEEFLKARKINKEHKYEQFKNIDMTLVEASVGINKKE